METSDYTFLNIFISRLIREQVLVDDIILRGHCYCFERTLRERSSSRMYQNYNDEILENTCWRICTARTTPFYCMGVMQYCEGVFPSL